MSTPAPSPDTTVIRLTPDVGQRALINILRNPANREVYVIGSRRRGKSWTFAVCIAEFALSNPFSPADKGTSNPRQTEIAIVAPDYARAEPIFKELQRWFGKAIVRVDLNAMEITFRGGAIVKCWTSENLDSIRGRGYDIVVADEAAFLNESLMESAVMPTLLDRQGRLWAPSTPKFGRRNWWCARWLAADVAQKADEPLPGVIAFHLGTTWDNPRLDPADIEREVARRDPLTVREEYKGEILDNASNFLDHTKLRPVRREDIPPNTYKVILIDSAWGKPRASLIDKITQRRKDATVIAVVGQDTNGNAYFEDGVWSETLQQHEAFAILEGFLKKYPIKRIGKEIVGDDPFFSQWNQYCKEHVGIPHVTQAPFNRSKDWKIDGIRFWAGELLFQNRMFIANDCVLWPHLIDEMGKYTEAAAISDKCHDDILTVASDILQPSIWQGNRLVLERQAKNFDPFFLDDAMKQLKAHPRRPKQTKYCAW